jgi:hypothetical protein
MATMEHRASAMVPRQNVATTRRGADAARRSAARIRRGADAAMEGWEADVFRAERWAVGSAEELWMNMKEE